MFSFNHSTPLCHIQHLPGFVSAASNFASKGVDGVYCVATNDVFVLDAWAKAEKAGGKVTMLADGNGDFVKALGLAFDGSQMSFGPVRSKRWAMIVEDGVVKYLGVDEKGGLQQTGADAVLAKL